MVHLKGTWSRDEAFPAFNWSTDVYRFVSLLQCSTVYSVTCKVIQRDGYVLLDCGCEDGVERACCCGGFLILLYTVDDIIWSLKSQSSLMEVFDVLVHFLFLAKLHRISKKKYQFGFTMTSVHKMR